MAIDLLNKTNATGASSAYPYGQITDNDGSDNGTPVNVEVYGDFHQFFARMFAMAGGVYTNHPDNATYGFQYYEALDYLIHGGWGGGDITFTNSGNNTWGNKGSGYNKAHYYRRKNIVFLAGVVRNTSLSSPTSSDILTLPSAVRPQIPAYVAAYSDSAGGMIMLKINTNGKVTSTSPMTGDLYLDSISYKLTDDVY